MKIWLNALYKLRIYTAKLYGLNTNINAKDVLI